MKTLPTLAAVATLTLASWPLHAQQDQPNRPPAPPQREGQRQNQPERGVPLFFRILDTNHDGAIDADEMAHAGEALRKLDRNGDGRLTPEDMQPQRDGQAPSEMRREGDAQRRPEAGQGARGGERRERGEARNQPDRQPDRQPGPPPAERDAQRGPTRDSQRGPALGGARPEAHQFAMGPRFEGRRMHQPSPFVRGGRGPEQFRHDLGARGPQDRPDAMRRPMGPQPQEGPRPEARRDGPDAGRQHDAQGPDRERRPAFEGPQGGRPDDRRMQPQPQRDGFRPRPPQDRDDRSDRGPQRGGRFGDAENDAPAPAPAVAAPADAPASFGPI